MSANQDRGEAALEFMDRLRHQWAVKSRRNAQTRSMTREIEHWHGNLGESPPWLVDRQMWEEDQRMKVANPLFDLSCEATERVCDEYKRGYWFRFEEFVFARWWLSCWLGNLLIWTIGCGPTLASIDAEVARLEEKRAKTLRNRRKAR
jgi:hypothetical protein